MVVDAHPRREAGLGKTPAPGSEAGNLRPWQVDTFKLSKRQNFEACSGDWCDVGRLPPVTRADGLVDTPTEVMSAR